MSSCTIAPKAGTRPRSSSTPGHRPRATLHTSSRLGAGVVLNQTQLFRRLDWGGVKRSFDAEENNGESLPNFVVQFLRDALPLGFLDR